MYSTFFLASLYLEHVRHYRALQTGAAFLPRTITVAVLSQGVTERLGRRFGPLPVLMGGMAVLWLTIHALGYDVPAAPLLLAYLIGYLANAIPIPGGLGVLDGGLAGALLLYHVPAPAALGGVLLYHALALWIPALSGTVGFIAAQRQINSGEVRGEIGQATDGAALRPSTSDERRGGREARERRSSSATQQTCSPRFSECG